MECRFFGVLAREREKSALSIAKVFFWNNNMRTKIYNFNNNKRKLFSLPLYLFIAQLPLISFCDGAELVLAERARLYYVGGWWLTEEEARIYNIKLIER